MSRIPEGVRQRVRQRANHRCEYCLSHQDYVTTRLQIDHVIPLIHGGSDDEDNLGLACGGCNGHKWTKTEGIDPESEQRVPLFYPRLHTWQEHFAWGMDGAMMLGLTPIGRATIFALRMNEEPALTVRRNWVHAGWHPPKIS